MDIELIRYELKLLFRHKFLKLLFIGLGMLVLLGGYNGYSRVEKQLSIIEEVKQKQTNFYTQNLLLLDSIEKKLRPPSEGWYKNPASVLFVGAFREAGKYTILPPSSLAFFSTGQSDIYPYYTKVNIVSNNAAKDNQNFENPFALALGKFDLTFVCVFLLPLFIIAFSYNILSSEKEQGTLVLISSMPISTSKWLFLKISIRTFLFCLITFFWLGIAFISFSFDVFETFSEMIVLLFYILIYIFFWFGVAYGINYLDKNSATNALTLVGIWLFFVLILPSVANLLATVLYPVPSRTIYVIEQKEAEEQTEKQKDKILKDFYAKNPTHEKKKDVQNWKTRYTKRFAVDAYQQRLKSEIDSKFENYAASQREFALRFRWLSPSVLLHHNINKIAKTDTETYKNFQKDTQKFRKEWSDYFIKIFYEDRDLTTKDYENFPSYSKK
ncbi:protein of unknown function (DUF3526) [Bernardetia litoralis DSM 6794]|uniref:ABC-type transport system involved in multi-copper enzyme maturation, permease component n=1 Tax=Bernardetia litoralis (strain ATCC 23117 / DSM 6794 / NBRC 15988 / NCIMB 1366 / Fx l1 / Sio-4) TaxID=880071 RepID=I4AIL5_BERLS|nr:DUF3526 domain-containing protein [Bernardetia litoralis]AFM03800.1 protein of unknown function (DUF3526) [Bernardetia litoralis DSM 6794]